MGHLIDKDILVIEIKRRISNLEQLGNRLYIQTNFPEQYRLIHGYESILSFINTLEVKEVDFDALGVLAEHLIACEAHAVTPKYKDGELDILEGLVNNKVQKEE